ncbi:hypothetical protein G6011_00385 [Alternaria panax]|uniref:Uncharacterized protein n=1 Tax=Alternaria panax TaxID=48097 RepID=A0AAD4NVQ3_9PLEO|nr:hypothetical protein G6011_00385 [Alternaria panax]
MKIDIGYDQIDVDGRSFRAWFPQLSYMSGFDGDLVGEIMNRINGRYGITKYDIEWTLVELFKKLGQNFGFLEGQTRTRLVGALMSQVKKDMQEVWNAKGLRSSRHMFIILAYLASDGQSVQLAEALHQFRSQGMQYLMQDSPKYHGDWHRAFEKIRELIEGPPNADLGALTVIPFAGLHHRRSPRALALRWPGHRARSLPAVRHHHDPDMRLAIPSYNSSVWTSPMISPVGYPRNDYFEKLDNLQYQQSEMSMKLDNVDGKLDLLLAGYY